MMNRRLLTLMRSCMRETSNAVAAIALCRARLANDRDLLRSVIEPAIEGVLDEMYNAVTLENKLRADYEDRVAAHGVDTIAGIYLEIIRNLRKGNFEPAED